MNLLTYHIVRSLCSSWASCYIYCVS